MEEKCNIMGRSWPGGILDTERDNLVRGNDAKEGIGIG